MKPIVDITKIHNSQNVLGLIMTFYVSFATSARKTALIGRTVFNIPVSYQTVLNYAEAAAHYCHQFNLKNLEPHMALNYQPPIPVPELDAVTTIQGKWVKILSMAA